MQFDPHIHLKNHNSEVAQLQNISQRLNRTLQRDQLVQRTINNLRQFLQVDRVVLYYFYTQWKGQVTFESLSHQKWSIFGSTGPDQCFNDEYATLYSAGRVKAIADIETEPIEACHREFLRYLNIRANLVAPILTQNQLWGLLIAHHCQSTRSWKQNEIEQIKTAALTLAAAPSINKNSI